MNQSIADLEASPSPQAVAAFLTSRSFPIVEGNTVTFVYHGAADAVRLRHWIYGLQASPSFRRIDKTDLWYHAMQIPECSRVEYKIEVESGGDSRWILDPLNPHRAHDPFGANSVCHGAGYAVPEFAEADPESRQGSLEQLVVPSRSLGERRAVAIYLPARFRRRARYPLLVVHDGSDYLRYSNLKTVLDNLIHRLEIPSLVVALLDPGDRLREYADCADHAAFLVDELLPGLERAYPLVGTPAARGLMGASFGAVATLAAAWRHPAVFGKLLLQSGSFGFTDIGDHRRGPAFDPVVRFVNAFRAAPAALAEKVFVSCGMYESLIYENRSLVPLLQQTGMAVRYVEARDGHNWENWRDRLREGLSWLFPGPLWMVYE